MIEVDAKTNQPKAFASFIDMLLSYIIRLNNSADRLLREVVYIQKKNISKEGEEE